MLPVFHCASERPCFSSGAVSFQARSRSVRATADEIQAMATFRTSGESGTVFGAARTCLARLEDTLAELSVLLVPNTSSAKSTATMPAARIRPESAGSHHLGRRTLANDDDEAILTLR